MQKKKFEKPKMSELISRSVSEVRASIDEDNKDYAHITGYPIVFEQKTDISGLFSETIAKGAISESVLRDVDFFYNHDLNTKPLARTRNGRLVLNIDNQGVHMDSTVNLKRSDANDLYLAIQDDDIDGMSFMFRVEDEEWENLDTDYPSRRITKIGYVQEVSAVNYPAYEGTSINARANLFLDRDKQALDEARAKTVATVKQDEVELAKLKAKYLFNF